MTKIHKKFPLKALCRKGFRIRISKSGVKETRNIKLIRLPAVTSAHQRQLSRILKRHLAGSKDQSL